MPTALVHDLIAARAAERPAETVIVDGPVLLTRADLEAAATRQAAQLIEAGVRPRERVILCMPPGAQFSVVALSVMKIGAAYVPANPGADDSILERIRETVQPAAWMTTAEGSTFAPHDIPTLTAPDISLRTPGPSVRERCKVASFTRGVRPTDEVYGIFTSGTTGTPKGILVPHLALADLLHWQSNVLQMRTTDRVLQRSRLTFDFSVTEIWLSLTYGGTLINCPDAIRNDPSKVVRFIRANGITIAQFVPTVLEAVLAAVARESLPGAGDDMRAVVCNGEPLSDDTRRRFYRTWREATLWNQYGPAEATVAVTSRECPRVDEPELMTVGTPMGGNRVLVLDADLAPVPDGEVGEVCIAGSQLASGYVGASAEEQARFVAGATTSGRLYRTGDLGRYTGAGELELLGRLDHQAKFRGVRLELEVVARAIEGFEGVRQAAVRVQSFDGPDGRRRQILTALVTPAEIEVLELKAYCRERLAPCSIPGLVLPVEEFRVTPNGKLDFDEHLREAAEARLAAMAGRERSATAVEDIVIEILVSHFGVSFLGEPEHMELDSLGIDSLDRVVLVHELEARGLTLSIDHLAKPSITPRQIASTCSAVPRERCDSVAPTIDDVLKGLDSAASATAGPQTVALHASIPNLLGATDSTYVATFRRALVDHLVGMAAAGTTVVIPAFTPSFASSRWYHFEGSVSEAGSLATWVQDDVVEAVRSHDPIYSHVVLGPLGDFPIVPSPRTPFGSGSVAAWLEERDAIIIGLGTRDFTQTHRIEFLAEAPHHAGYEVVQGIADYGFGALAVSGDVYIRDNDYHRTGKIFAQNTATTESLLDGILRTSSLGNSSVLVRSMTCLDLRQTLLPILQGDPVALLATPDLAMARLASSTAPWTRHEQGGN